MQLAAATAAKGTKRPMSGETCCRKKNPKKVILLRPYDWMQIIISPWKLLKTQSLTGTETEARSTLRTRFLVVVVSFQHGRTGTRHWPDWPGWWTGGLWSRGVWSSGRASPPLQSCGCGHTPRHIASSGQLGLGSTEHVRRGARDRPGAWQRLLVTALPKLTGRPNQRRRAKIMMVIRKPQDLNYFEK